MNAIGDLEEEYSAKIEQDGLTQTRRWFWIQVFCTLGASLKEEGVRCLSYGRAIQWYRRRDGSLQASFDAGQLGHNRAFALLIIILILCALLVYSLHTRTVSPGQELAQMRNIVSMLEAREPPQLDYIFDKSSLTTVRPMTPAAGRSQLKVSKKTAWTGTGTTTTIGSQSDEGQYLPLPVSSMPSNGLKNLVLTATIESLTSWKVSGDATKLSVVTVVQNAQAGEGDQGKEQNSAIAGDSTKIAGAETSPRTDVASVPRYWDSAQRFIEIKERDYLSAPSVVSKPQQQTQSQAYSERGCFR